MKDCSLDRQHPVGFSFLLCLALLLWIVAFPKSSENPVLKNTSNTVPGFPPVEYSAGASGTISPSDLVVKRIGSQSLTLAQLQPADKALQRRIIASYAKLPLHFEANEGQTDSKVRFLSRGTGYTVFLTDNEAAFVFDAHKDWPWKSSDRTPRDTPSIVSMKLVGASSNPLIRGLDELPGNSNYLRGDGKNSHTNIANFSKLKYEQIYPGIDLVYYSNQGQLEYDFVVAPGADPAAITLSFEGADGIEIDEHGDLVLSTKTGAGKFLKPHVYQVVDGNRHAIEGRYVSRSDNREPNSKRRLVSFELAAYDTGRPLVIDPVLAYSTLVGDTAMINMGMAVDALGHVYLAGTTHWVSFPTTEGSLQTSCTEWDPGFCGDVAFVTKINADGSSLIYSTYLGSRSRASGIGIDAEGNAYVTGVRIIADFPTVNPIQPCTGMNNIFVAKLAADGASLKYSTCLGGGGSGSAIAVDQSGNAFVTGNTAATDFPTTGGSFQPNCSKDPFCGFLVKFDPTGSFIYSTYLSGAQAKALSIDPAGNAYIIGSTVRNAIPITATAFQPTCDSFCSFVMKVNNTGTDLLYSTYLGRIADISGVTVDAAGSAYVTGTTKANDIPATPGAFQSKCKDGPIGPCGQGDVFVAKVSADGSTLLYATYIGGSDIDEAVGIAVDSTGHVYVTGMTRSTDFPSLTAIQGPCSLPPGSLGSSCSTDVFLTKLNPSGTDLIFSTNLGGDSSDRSAAIALDSTGNAYVTGLAGPGFPTTPGAFRDCEIGTIGCIVPIFVAKIASSVQFDAATYSVAENAGQKTIAVLSDGFAESVSVNFTTTRGTAADDSDYVPASGVLTFLPGETVKTFTVPILNDSIFEGKETILLALTSPTGPAVLGNPAAASLTITEPGKLQFSSPAYTVNENSGNAIINVTRLEGNSGEVQVSFAVDGGTATPSADFTPMSGDLTFSDGETSKSITVPILNDSLVEPDETVRLTLSDPTGGALLGVVPDATLNISDNDISLEGYFPFSPGDTWTYQRLDDGAITQVTALAQNTVINGVATEAFRNSIDGSQEYYSLDGNGLQLHRLFTPKVMIEGLGKVDIALTFTPPVKLSDLVSAVGRTSESSGVVQTNAIRRIGALSFPYTASFSFEGVYTVTLPAGTYDVLRLRGTINIWGEAPTEITMDLAKGVGRVRLTSTDGFNSETDELTATTVGLHDLAVTKISPPKTVTLTSKTPVQTKQVIVAIQNHSTRPETIQDETMLASLVQLELESLGHCPAPTATLHRGKPQIVLPKTVQKQQKISVVFDVTFDCANDPSRGSGHADFRYRVTLNPAAFGTLGDTPSPPEISPLTALGDVAVR